MALRFTGIESQRPQVHRGLAVRPYHLRAQISQERTLYERVWREPPPHRSGSDHFVARNETRGSLSAASPSGHGRWVEHENSISELIDQLDAWDTQKPLMANQIKETIMLALEALAARVAQLHKICEGWQHPRNPVKGLCTAVESWANPPSSRGESGPHPQDIIESSQTLPRS